eukprot:s3096_g1.t1
MALGWLLDATRSGKAAHLRLTTSTWLLRGRRGTHGSGLALVARLVAAGPVFCVAGVAPGDMYFRLAWQARYLTTSPWLLRGSAQTALGWLLDATRSGKAALLRGRHAWHLTTSGPCRCGGAALLRGRRGTW